MAKVKENSSKGVQNKHLFSRAAYMYHAAAYLSARVKPATTRITEGSAAEASSSNEALIKPSTSVTTSSTTSATPAPTQLTRPTLLSNGGRHLLTQMRGVSRKTQTRLSHEIKRSVCKRCDTLLVPGQTSSAQLENESKGGRKKCADVYVVRCLICGTAKRFPVGVERQVRKGLRVKKVGEAIQSIHGVGKEVADVENVERPESEARGVQGAKGIEGVGADAENMEGVESNTAALATSTNSQITDGGESCL